MRVCLAATLPFLVACPFDNPTQDEFVRDWATVLCEQRTACGCATETCEDDAAARLLELWPEDAGWLPDKECWDARMRAIEALDCEEAERTPFDWELRACRPWTSFSSLGEPCEPPPESGSFGTGCENGLVCDAVRKRCVNPAELPTSGQPCLVSSDGYAPDGVCASGLVCTDDVCVEGSAETTEPPPLLCSGDVYVF